jgi:5-methylcytosine-specific restriction endonuclease McrA
MAGLEKIKRHGLSRTTKDRVWTQSHGKCYWCFKQMIRATKGQCVMEHDTFTVDHKIPMAAGGAHDCDSNLVGACYECNHDRTKLVKFA